MARAHSYVLLLDLEYDALVLDTFHHRPALIQDDHFLTLLAHIESIPVDIIDEMDDLLLEFLITIFFRSQAMGSPASIAQVMSKRILETCAS